MFCSAVRENRATPSHNCTVKWPKPHRRWFNIHIDHFFFEGSIFLVAIDTLTKYIEYEIVNSTSAVETVDTLRSIFSSNGLPGIIVSDNATSFTAL